MVGWAWARLGHTQSVSHRTSNPILVTQRGIAAAVAPAAAGCLSVLGLKGMLKVIGFRRDQLQATRHGVVRHLACGPTSQKEREMDLSGKSKYLTPCRTFGLQRTQKRTPGSKGSTPQGGSGSSLNAPFRSPLIADGFTSTPLAKKKTTTPKPSWSTPLLPKSRFKMGLSKPSPKAHPLANIQSKSSIQTYVSTSEPPRRDSCGNKPRILINKITALGHSNSLRKSILQSAEANITSSSSLQPNDSSCKAQEGGESDQMDEKILVQLAGELTQTTVTPKIFEETQPSTSSNKAQLLDELSSWSESNSDDQSIGDNMQNSCSLGEAHKKLNSSSSSESFCGWDLENDQESLDCDSKRELFQKCIPMFINHHESSNQQCGSSKSKEVPSKRYSEACKLSFVKEKFKSKRRLLSDSEDSGCDADDNFSLQRKRSQDPNDSADMVPLGPSDNRIKTETKNSKLVSAYSNDEHVTQSSKSIVQKSNVPSSVTGECRVVEVQPDSEKENCDSTNSVENGSKSWSRSGAMKNKAKSRRRVLSDTDDDDDDISVHMKPNRSHLSSPSSVVGNVKLGNDPNSGNQNLVDVNTIAGNRVKKIRLPSDSNDDTDDDSDAKHIQGKPVDTRSANVKRSARSETDEKPNGDEESTKLGNSDLTKSQSSSNKCDLPSNSDCSSIRNVSKSLAESFVPDSSTPPESAKMEISSDSDLEKGHNVNPIVTLKTNMKIIHDHETGPGRHETRSELYYVLSDSDDDSFIVEKPHKKPPENYGHISAASPKDAPNSSKVKLVVELRRLPKSALSSVDGEGLGNTKQNSQSSNGKDSADDDIEGFGTSQKNLKTYDRSVLKKKEKVKKPGRLGYTRHPSDKSGAKHSCLDESITLPNGGVKPDEDYEVERHYVDGINETDDFERIKSEMQKWLVGGQQVISKIIEEVRLQRDKDMSVMEVLQEHNIDPNLVGYDPAVEEFVSFDKFLLKNDLK